MEILSKFTFCTAVPVQIYHVGKEKNIQNQLQSESEVHNSI